MVVEHIFITTMSNDEAMNAALQFLQQQGFVNAEQYGFRMATDLWTSLKMKRGRSKPAKNLRLIDLPQTVKVDWDRGKVTVAAAIEAFGKEEYRHQKLLSAIVLALEELLSSRVPPEQAGSAWREEESTQRLESSRVRKRRTITLVVVVIFLAIALAALISAIASTSR